MSLSSILLPFKNNFYSFIFLFLFIFIYGDYNYHIRLKYISLPSYCTVEIQNLFLVLLGLDVP